MSEISREELFWIWLSKVKSEKTEAVEKHVISIFGPDVDDTKIKDRIKKLCFQFQSRWSKSHRDKARFMHDNAIWLSSKISAVDFALDHAPSTSKQIPQRGRREKEFAESASSTQKRKCKELISNVASEQLTMATAMHLRSCGKRDSANIVKELSAASPSRGTAIKRARVSITEKKSLTPDQALAMIVDENLSTEQYRGIRLHTIPYSPKLYPCYDLVKQSKLLCYPSLVTVTETYAEINLQSLIDHTVKRLIDAQYEVFKSFSAIQDELSIIIKWGCDGAEQNRYKQKFSDDNMSDESMFSLSMVPLQLNSGAEGRKHIFWQNPAASSTRYCRPIKFIFTKETREVIKAEVEHIRQQISVLKPTKFELHGYSFTVKANLILCMIDGKVCTALSNYTSSQACYLCGSTPKTMNDMNALSQREIDENMLAVGLSPLHAYIRFMECLLHISYRLEIEKWYVSGDENKESVARRKKKIQDRFRNEMGLLVDMPKQKTGNTNDGNTARRFFKEAEKTSDITGINVDLIKRFRVILICINSGYFINIDAFQNFTSETRELYLSLYPWYYMPVTVHKILFHGGAIISSCILPIGNFSEEAQEARNKESRQYRELFTRKTSRVDTNIDLLHRLLITSDPLIASLRLPPKTKRSTLPSEVIALLSDTQLNDEFDDLA